MTMAFILLILCVSFVTVRFIDKKYSCQHKFEKIGKTTVSSECGFEYYLYELRYEKCGDISSRRVK